VCARNTCRYASACLSAHLSVAIVDERHRLCSCRIGPHDIGRIAQYLFYYPKRVPKDAEIESHSAWDVWAPLPADIFIGLARKIETKFIRAEAIVHYFRRGRASVYDVELEITPPISMHTFLQWVCTLRSCLALVHKYRNTIYPFFP